MKNRTLYLLMLAMFGAVAVLVAQRGVSVSARALSGAIMPTARAQQPDPALPAVPLIPPIPERYLRALPAGLSVVIRDIALDHRRVNLRVPYLQVVGSTGDGLRLSLVHVRGARIISKQTGVVLPIDPFMKLTDQRIEIGRLRIDDTSITRRLLTGVTQWYFNDIDLDARDVALGGMATELLRLVHADLHGEFDGEPLVLKRLTANVRRDRNRLGGDMDAQLAETRARVNGSLTRAGAYAADVTAETSNYGELHPFLDEAPRAGAGMVVARLEGEKDRATVALHRADARLNASSLAVSGVMQTGTGGRLQNVVVDIDRLHSADLKLAYDTELPGGGELRGRVTADGPLAAGVQVAAALHRITAKDSTLLRLNGTVLDDAGLRMDMRAQAQPVRAADTLFVVDLRGRGSIDSLAVTGDITLAKNAVLANGDDDGAADAVRDARVTLDALIMKLNDARVLRGTAAVGVTVTDRTTGEPVALKGRMDGEVRLASDGAIAAELKADSMPLRLVPAPSAVHDVEGVATGAVRITGTVEEPRWSGAINVSGGGLRVRRAETRLTGLQGVIRVENDVVSTAGLIGALGDGRIELTGSAQLRGATRPVAATVRIDRGLIVNNDSLRAVASSELRLDGDLSAPRVRGQVVVHHGRFDEDMLKESEPLDLDRPPYAVVAARVPWIRESRLLARDTVPATEARTRSRPLDLDVTLRVEREFRIVDEDSETFGVAELRFTTDSTGVIAAGSYRIEGGAYNNFGERFRVLGGIFHFPGQGTLSRVSLRGQHEPGAPFGRDLGNSRHAFDFFPPLESFGIGSLSFISEEVRRFSMLPETMTELGGVLLYREPVEPVTEWRARRWWRADAGATVLGPRAATQLFPLLWAYTADETYDLIPLDKAYLRASTIEVGPAYPGRTVIAGVIGGGLRSAPFELDVRQPLKGNAWPGMQLRYETGAWRMSVFNEPRFNSVLAAGAASGYTQSRRSGLRLLWRREW